MQSLIATYSYIWIEKKLDAFELWVWRKIQRKEIKQRNLAKSETKHFVRSHEKKAENAIFWTRDEETSILGDRYNARKKRSPVCDARHQKYKLTLNK